MTSVFVLTIWEGEGLDFSECGLIVIEVVRLEVVCLGVGGKNVVMGRVWYLGVMEIGMLRMAGVALSMPGCRKVHSVRWLARVGIMLVMYASPRSCGVGTGVFDLRGSRERE